MDCLLSCTWTENTKIVYCKDYRRKEAYKQIQFDFLGFSFQPRSSKDKQTGNLYVLFDLAISRTSQKKIVEEIKRFNIQRFCSGTIEEIAARLNPKLQGWINYYGKFRRWILLNIFRKLRFRLLQWVKNKYKISSVNKCHTLMVNFQKAQPNLFSHWKAGFNE